MSYKLSKREKTLLYALLVLVIVLGGWFFMVKPSLSEYTEKQIKLSEDQMKLNHLKATYDDYANASAKALEESARFLTNQEAFHKPMNNEDIDKMMTGMALLHGLEPISLNIGETTPANISAYTTNLEDADDAAKENAKAEEEVLVNKVEVSMSLAGGVFNAFALADSIKDNTSLRLKDYSYVKAETVEDSSMVLVFEIYILNE